MTTVLVTGSSGYIGQLLVAELASLVGNGQLTGVIACDVREPASLPAHATWVEHDVRRPTLASVFTKHRVDVVIHLASFVTPPKGTTRELAYSVMVDGMRNVLDVCIATKIHRLVVASSGSAYGYHADNPELLTESDPLRGNKEFSYSWNKRKAEEILADYRRAYPRLEQVVFRISTILGKTVHNQISALFERRRLIAITGSSSPFVFIDDRDVVACLIRAIDSQAIGVYNVAGDGTLTVEEIAALLHKPVLRVPAWTLEQMLALFEPFGVFPYGPEQVNFLRYRPVLDNSRLKTHFGYAPTLTSRGALEYWRDTHMGHPAAAS